MAKRRMNPNVVKLNRTYDATQLAACCGVHKNTVLNWRKAGLEFDRQLQTDPLSWIGRPRVF